MSMLHSWLGVLVDRAFDPNMTCRWFEPVDSLVNVHHLRSWSGWPSVTFRLLGGISCLFASWYFC